MEGNEDKSEGDIEQFELSNLRDGKEYEKYEDEKDIENIENLECVETVNEQRNSEIPTKSTENLEANLQNPEKNESNKLDDKTPTTENEEIKQNVGESNTVEKLRPEKATNIFIKQLVEKIVEERGKFSGINQQLLEKLKSSILISFCKYDEAFIELCLNEICNLTLTTNGGFAQLVEEFLDKNRSIFNRISLGFKCFVNSCLLYLVDNKEFNALCLRKFLVWCLSLQKYDFIKDEWEKWFDEMKKPFEVQNKIYVNEAMIQACKLGKPEMIFEFLNKGFYLYDKDFKSCDVLEGGDMEAHRNKLVENRFNQRHLQIFRATSSPTFQIARFSHLHEKYDHEDNEKLWRADVFSQTLHNLQIAKNLSVDQYDLVEYNNQLQKVINDGRTFLVDLISRCETLDEAKLLLSHDSLKDHYFLKYETSEWAYSRLDEACLSKHKRLVTHDFSQRIFREEWQKSNNLQNVKSGLMMRVLVKSLFCPLYIFFFLFVYLPMESFGTFDSGGGEQFKAKLKKIHDLLPDLFFHYTVPVNRCISDFISHIFFILLILVSIINPNDQPRTLDVDWYDVLLGVWAFGFCVKCSRGAIYFMKDLLFSGSTYKWTHWKRSAQGIRDIYEVVQFLCCTSILLGMLFKFIGFDCMFKPDLENKTIFNCNCPIENPDLFRDDSFMKTGYTLIGLGATLCFLNLLHFFEFSSYFGPIILSLRQTVHDVLKILSTFIIFLIAFSMGLHFSLMHSNMYCEDEYEQIEEREKYFNRTFNFSQETVKTKLTGFVLESNVNHFRDYREAIKTCFWSLFDPGHPEVVGCTQGPPRHLGMFLWGSYQIINVVIVMNLLIALMNATVAGIQEDKITEWRFARTLIWRKYFDHYKICHLPVPFNVPEMMMNLVLRMIKRKNGDENVEAGVAKQTEERQKEYLNLVSKLCGRYIHMKNRNAEKKANIS